MSGYAQQIKTLQGEIDQMQPNMKVSPPLPPGVRPRDASGAARHVGGGHVSSSYPHAAAVTNPFCTSPVPSSWARPALVLANLKSRSIAPEPAAVPRMGMGSCQRARDVRRAEALPLELGTTKEGTESWPDVCVGTSLVIARGRSSVSTRSARDELLSRRGPERPLASISMPG